MATTKRPRIKRQHLDEAAQDMSRLTNEHYTIETSGRNRYSLVRRMLKDGDSGPYGEYQMVFCDYAAGVLHALMHAWMAGWHWHAELQRQAGKELFTDRLKQAREERAPKESKYKFKVPERR